jgi:hypothetical protein
MGATKRRYSKEEFARRGEAIFEDKIRAHLKGENARHFLVIDIETGDYEIDADEQAASDRLRTRVPDAQIWFRRVGSHYARKFGLRRLADQ